MNTIVATTQTTFGFERTDYVQDEPLLVAAGFGPGCSPVRVRPW